MTVAPQVTWSWGGKGSFLESGVGGNLWTGLTNASGYTERAWFYGISPIVEYRFQSRGGFLFRLYANPIISLTGTPMIGTWLITPYAGTSLGFAF